jgi:hypothetical protein
MASVDRQNAMKGHGAKSEVTRERAILTLLSETSIGAAAARCEVGERTLRRWMAEDETFKAELAAARSAMFEAGMSRVQALTMRAVDTLEDLLEAKKYPSVRLGAARTVVELGLHQYDAETILRKLQEIEARQRK